MQNAHQNLNKKNPSLMRQKGKDTRSCMKKRDNDIPNGYARVTEILRPFTDFSSIDPAVLHQAADRGTRVHTYCESHALGLFVAEVDEDCKNYFEAFKSWFDEFVVKVLHAETRMNSPSYRISGACDLIAILKGDDFPSLIDIKTPSIPFPTWQLQTAAYQILAKEVLDVNVQRRICLILPKYKDQITIKEYENHAKDQALFIKALELFRFFRN